jgi:hypothetical protein
MLKLTPNSAENMEAYKHNDKKNFHVVLTVHISQNKKCAWLHILTAKNWLIHELSLAFEIIVLCEGRVLQ